MTNTNWAKEAEQCARRDWKNQLLMDHGYMAGNLLPIIMSAFYCEKPLKFHDNYLDCIRNFQKELEVVK